MNKRLLGYGAGGVALAAGLAAAGVFGYRHFVQGRTGPDAAAAAVTARVLKMDATDAPPVPLGAVKIAPVVMKKTAPASQPAQPKPAAAKPTAAPVAARPTTVPVAAKPQAAEAKAAPKPQLIQPKPAPAAAPKPAASSQTAQQKKARVISIKGGGARPGPAASAPLTPADRASLSVVHQLRSLRNAIGTWRYRNNGQTPDFITHSAWEQFVKSGPSGQILSQTPVNPLNGFSAVMAISGEARVGENVGGTFGYVYSTGSGRLWATDRERRVLDEAAIDTLGLEVRAVRELSPREAEQHLLVGLDSIRNQVALYQMQHGDRQPDFRNYPAFEQLLKATTAEGRIVDGDASPSQSPKGPARFGPYLLSTPVNPVNGRYKVATVAGDVKPGQKVDADAGFVFSTGRGQLFATDASGCVLDDAKAREAYLPRNATAAAPLNK